MASSSSSSLLAPASSSSSASAAPPPPPQRLVLDACDSPVAAVTVFPEGSAEITRNFSLHLDAGSTLVDIVNLPLCIDKDRLRVRGKGQRPVVISDVVYHPPDLKRPFVPDAKCKAELKQLHADLEAARAEKNVLLKQIKALESYGTTMQAASTPLGDLLAYVETLGVEGRRRAAELQAIEERLDALERAVEEHTDANSLDNDNRALRRVRIGVALSAAEPTTVSLDVVYCCLSPSIRWSPAYDLRVASADGGKPSQSVELHFRAIISQKTGEDWRDCVLSLSTVKTHRSAAIPRHGRVTVAVAKPAPPQRPGSKGGPHLLSNMANLNNLNMQQQQQMQLMQMQMQMQQQSQQQLAHHRLPPAAIGATAPYYDLEQQQASSSSSSGEGYEVVDAAEDADMAPEEFVDFETRTTTVTDKAVGGVFLIDGLSTIPSDSATHKVSIAVLKCQSLVRWIAVPHVNPGVVYTECQVRNTSGYQLYPGPVSIFLDDGYVANSEIKHVNLNEFFSCSLGVDPSLRVHHRDTVRTLPAPTSAYAPRTETRRHETAFVVRNKGRSDVPRLFIKDSLPVVGGGSGGSGGGGAGGGGSSSGGGPSGSSGSSGGPGAAPSGFLLDPADVRVVLRQPRLVADGEAVRGDVPVADGVVARWASYAGGDREGRVEFVCDVPAGKEVAFSLVYEVVGPVGTDLSVVW